MSELEEAKAFLEKDCNGSNLVRCWKFLPKSYSCCDHRGFGLS